MTMEGLDKSLDTLRGRNLCIILDQLPPQDLTASAIMG